MYVINITNTSSSPVRVPFKVGTPYDIRKTVNGIIPVAKRCLIPTKVSEYIDQNALKHFEKLGILKYTIKEYKEVKLPVVTEPKPSTDEPKVTVGRKRAKDEIKVDEGEAR